MPSYYPYYYYDAYLFYYIRSVIFDIGLLLIILQIIKEYQKKLRWYQTPFVLLFLAFIENLSFYLSRNWLFIVDSIQIIVSPIIEFVLIILIIFLDKEFQMMYKIITLISFIVISLLFLFIPDLLYFYYMFYVTKTLYGLGSIECLVCAIKEKNYEIIPIFTLVCILLVNVFDIITYLVLVDPFIVIASVIGILSCISQLIVYCILRYKRNIQQNQMIQQPMLGYVPPQQIGQPNMNQQFNPLLPSDAYSKTAYIPVCIQTLQNTLIIPISPILQMLQPNQYGNMNIQMLQPNQSGNMNIQMTPIQNNSTYEKPQEEVSNINNDYINNSNIHNIN